MPARVRIPSPALEKMRTSHITDKNLRLLMGRLSKEKAPVWRAVVEELSRPRRIRRSVNLLRINRFTKEGDSVVVPGKVLSLGDLDHKVHVYAVGFSELAKKKIERSGSARSLEEAIGKKGLKIIG